MEVPSWRRVYRSRALRRAICASGACRDPTCTWLRPRLARTNTSHSGHRSFAGILVSSGRDIVTLFCVRRGSLAHPLALLVGGAPVADAFGIRLALPAQDLFELLPV